MLFLDTRHSIDLWVDYSFMANNWWWWKRQVLERSTLSIAHFYCVLVYRVVSFSSHSSYAQLPCGNHRVHRNNAKCLPVYLIVYRRVHALQYSKQLGLVEHNTWKDVNYSRNTLRMAIKTSLHPVGFHVNFLASFGHDFGNNCCSKNSVLLHRR
jgi:hypothetical protein